MFQKYVGKVKREILKRDAKKFSALISKYNLDLYLNDSTDTLFKIEAFDNFRHLFKDRSYLDGSILEIINKNCSDKKVDVCIDVGANYGLVSVLLARNAKQVFAFEPEPKNLARMKKIIAKNSVTNIEVLPKAASNTCGFTKFFISKASSHHSLGKAHPGQNQQDTIDVETITLDFFCKSRNIENVDILKVDVEGYENEVFEGAKDLLTNGKIKKIFFEVSLGVMQRLNRDPFEPIKMLESFGYKITDKNGNSVTSKSGNSIDGQDLVAMSPRP